MGLITDGHMQGIKLVKYYIKSNFKTDKLDLLGFSDDPSHLAVLSYSFPSQKNTPS